MRREALASRRALTADEREFASLAICNSIFAEPSFRRARNVATYLPASDEVDTWPLIERAWRMKKRVFVPVLEKRRSFRLIEILPDGRLQTNRYGLLEPAEGRRINPRRLDIVFAPLVAFDHKGDRIGMGGGYFDRVFSFLARRRNFAHPKLTGLAFACQRVEHIPASHWDIRLFQVYTEIGRTC